MRDEKRVPIKKMKVVKIIIENNLFKIPPFDFTLQLGIIIL